MTGAQLTALRFDGGGLQLAAGTSSGLVGLWDLRQRAPLLVKDHMYGEAIRDIKFHTGGVRRRCGDSVGMLGWASRTPCMPKVPAAVPGTSS